MGKIFTDVTRVLTYNAILNIVIGERGVGKSYSSKKYVIKHFLKTKKKFVYLRRYKTELKESVPKFFDDLILNKEFPLAKFKSDGNEFYCNDKLMGYALSLSTAHILKSSTFADVDTIIFDEFLIDKGCYHYLRNEVEQMLDIIETIGRLRPIKVLMLGNAISITNPYFSFFNLTLPHNTDIQTFKNGTIALFYIDNEPYREVKRASKFGELIRGTNYEKYAIDNNFLRDSKTFIKKKPASSKFYFTIVYNNKYYGVWVDAKTDMLYISYKYDPACPKVFTFRVDDHTFNSKMIKIGSNLFFKSFIDYFRYSKMCFENMQIKNNILELLSKYLTY